MTIIFVLGLFCLLATLAVSLYVALGVGGMTEIGAVAPLPAGEGPRVSIIVPACNEAATIEPALRSLLALEYDNLEIIVVDDRSTDGTGQVPARLAENHPNLRVHRIDELPGDWLGKNYALQFGAERASGEYLLFTDADVKLEESTLSRGMNHLLDNRLDHLSIFFENVGGTPLLNALILEVGGGLLLLFRPWRARDPKSRSSMGVGAFNLIRAATYRALGGHRRIAMHPVDDVMLGRLVKEEGYRQDCLLGRGFVTVPWYPTVREFVNGLMKNCFALYNYRVSAAAAGVVAIFLLGALPAWGLLLAGGPARLLFAGAVGIRLYSFGHGFRQLGLSPRHACWSLLTPYITIYITARAAYLTLRNGGIDWRGTHYPLAKLKGHLGR